jgi:heavy metal sensor kinase
MNYSIRTKLTFWYVSILAVSLVVFSVSFHFALSKVYIDRIDAQIKSVAGMMVHTVVKPPGKLTLPRNFDVILERFFGVRTTGNYIQVLDSRGHVVARSSELEGINLPITTETYERAIKGEEVYETVKNFGVRPIRLFTKPVVMKDFGLFAIVQVASSLEEMEGIFRYMFYFFIFGIIGSIVVASGVGWLLARAALRPVHEITTMARRIGAESLDKRLDIHGPEDEMRRLASTFNDMIMRLDRSFEQIKQFTADASHELKTPLTVMKGEVEVALRGADVSEDLKEVLHSNLEEIDRMNHIINNLLALAKADAVKDKSIGEFVSFAKVVSERFATIKRTATARGIRLELTRNDQVSVLADPIRLGQVVSNLIDNAIKYTSEGGSVEVSLEEDGSSAILKVTDTGVGIAEKDIPYVFDRFYRTDKARTRAPGAEGGGVGLGLSICKEIVNSFYGNIEVTSELNVGSTFIVELPMAVFESDEVTEVTKVGETQSR